jgi:hypothetical protein
VNDLYAVLDTASKEHRPNSNFKKKEIDMKRNLLAALLGVALLLPVAAHAEGSYLKLGVGQSQYEGDVAEYQYFEKFNDVRASAFTFGLTYRF